MSWLHSPDQYFNASFWVAIGTLATTGSLLLAMLLIKLANRQRVRRDQAFVQAWQPLLFRAALGEDLPEPPPGLHRREGWRLLKLWVHLQSSLRGAPAEHLSRLGHRLALPGLALQLLRQEHSARQLYALLALGYLGERSAWPRLLAQLEQPGNALPLYAAWALLRIDTPAALPEVFERLLMRPDLDLARVSTLLKPFRAALHAELDRRLRQAAYLSRGQTQEVARVTRLLRLAQAMGLWMPAQDLLPWLEEGQPVDVLVGALRVLYTADGLSAVRALASHGEWPVRSQVASTLARIGEPDDVALLLQLLGDAQWWVRYRAAQALAALPFVQRDALAQRIAALPDRFAREMAQQVFAETGARP